MVKNCFTVDVEDGVSMAMKQYFGKDIEQSERVVHNTKYILNLLDEKKIKGTFFCLGKVAKKFPSLIRDIAESKHELAVHGFSHTLYDKLTKDEIFSEVSRSKKLIEDISGAEVFGHRAPAFSINYKNSYILDELVKAGYKYDSSIVPCQTNRYGWDDFPKDICNVTTQTSNNIIEVPITIGSFFNKRVPVCGGGYLRVMPYNLTNYYFKKISKIKPVILYMHPYEIDIEKYPEDIYNELKKKPLIENIKIRSTWMGRGLYRKKISKLLENYEFAPLIDIINKNKHQEFKIN